MTTRISLVPANEADWLAMRAADLTSTEIPALFGVSPYQTEFELFHYKRGTLKKDEKAFDTPRIKWGNRLESAIAYGMAEDFGVIVEPYKTYERLEGLRIGSSFDFKIVGKVEGWDGFDDRARDLFDRLGPGIMEIKNVDGLAFRRTWEDDGDGLEAPPHIEIQAQHQLLVSGYNWSMIAPLVGGNTPHAVFREADEPLHMMILEKCADFWKRFDEGTEPDPDFGKDAKTIGKLYLENDGSSIDLSDDPRVFTLCKAYKRAGADEKDAKDRKEAAKAELLTIIKGAAKVQATGFKISAGTTNVGTKVYVREASERFTISLSPIKQATVKTDPYSFRNVRITEMA